jgi:hypothetical protein
VKFRGIFAFLSAALVVAVVAAPANAAKLVYTKAETNATNSAIPVGDVVYTLALQTFASDGTGSFGISMTINKSGAGTSPVQTNPGLSGFGYYQEQQNTKDAAITAGTSVSPTLATAVAADTYFYASPTGQLTTDNIVNDPDFSIGPVAVQNDPKLTAAGLSANPFSLMWAPANNPNVVSNTSGGSISLTALWGSPTGDPSDPLTIASLIGPGVYPVAQIHVKSGQSVLLVDGGSLVLATPSGVPYNFLGAPGAIVGGSPTVTASGAFLSSDPNAYLTNALAIPKVPEPSTIVLAGLGIAGVLYASRRRK